jgi:threonyl-tRNA synthetase
VQIFNAGLRSYRDLPLRYGEFGSCHRNEPSGALHGIMRVRGFTQDDGHIFCTPAHIEPEVEAFHRRALEVYADFGFSDVTVKLALRPEKRLGTDDVWEQAENALRAALRKCGVGTIQVDFMMPGRLGAEYVDEDNTRKAPVMLHRAIVGSMERFIGILIENYAGALPVWLAPVQAVVMNISEGQIDYTKGVAAALRQGGLRAHADLRNEKISYKIREHSLQKLPYQVVVGDKEVAAQQVAVRSRRGEDLGRMSVEDFISRLKADEAQRGRSA